MEVESRPPSERNRVVSDRFDRFLPIAGVLAGLLFFVGSSCSGERSGERTGPAETYAYWQDDRGQHQIVALLVAPLIAFLLLFFGGGSAAATRAGQRRRRPRLGRVRRSDSWCCDLRPRRDARRCDDERSPRRRAGNGLHAEPAPLLRLAGMERGVRGDAARGGPRRSPERDAADAACVGDDRHRGVAPHAARVLRIHPRSGVVDRGRGLALPASDGRAASWLGRGRVERTDASRRS